MIDLGASTAVRLVKIINRQDCCQWRLNGFDFYIGDVSLILIIKRIISLNFPSNIFLPQSFPIRFQLSLQISDKTKSVIDQ